MRNVVVLLGRDVARELFGTVLARKRPYTPAELRKIRRLARDRGVDVLVEGRDAVAPVSAAVEGEVEAAVVEADPAVVLACEQIVRIERIEGDRLLRLTAERAILVHSLVPLAVPSGAAEGPGAGAEVRTATTVRVVMRR